MENHTLEDLKQKLINFLLINIGKLETYKEEINLLEIIIKKD